MTPRLVSPMRGQRALGTWRGLFVEYKGFDCALDDSIEGVNGMLTRLTAFLGSARWRRVEPSGSTQVNSDSAS